MPAWMLELLVALIVVLIMIYLFWSALLSRPTDDLADNDRGESHRGFERRENEYQDRRKLGLTVSASVSERRQSLRRLSD